jgi:hypothetical protein
MPMANIAICENCGKRSKEYIDTPGTQINALQGWFKAGTNDSSGVDGYLCDSCVDDLREALIERRVASDA